VEIYNGKIEILTFVILSIADRNLIIGVRFDLNVKKMRQMTSAVSDDSFIHHLLSTNLFNQGFFKNHLILSSN
jgi:hypothetical protein